MDNSNILNELLLCFNDTDKLYDKFINIVKNIHNQQKTLHKPDKYILTKILNHFFDIETLTKTMTALKIISNKIAELKKVDYYINKLQISFLEDEYIYEILSNDNKKNSIIRHIYSNMKKHRDTNLKKINDKIHELEYSIEKKIKGKVNYKPNNTNINKYVKNVPNEINTNIYFYLQRKIKDPEARLDLELQYFKKCNDCLLDLANLVIERNNLAIYNKKTCFFELVNNDTSTSDYNDIKLLIDDLLNKIELRSRKENERFIRELRKDSYEKKVDIPDVIYYYEKLRTKYLFSPEKVFSAILIVIQKYFGITAQEIQNNNTWGSLVKTYKFYSLNKQFMGLLHVDICDKYNSRSIVSPICLQLTNNYRNTPIQVCLVAGYTNSKANCMYFTDVLSFFKEIGSAIFVLSHTNNNGMIIDDEYNNIFSQTMEYIAWEKDVMKLLCHEYDNNAIDQILFTRYIDFGNAMKFRCINAIFDQAIHESDFMKALSVEYSDSMKKNIMMLWYNQIYSNCTKLQSDIVNTNISYINNTILYQEINGSAGKIYQNILTEMFAYNLLYYIKHDNEKNIIDIILSTNNKPIKKILKNIIAQNKNSNYDIYLKDLIEYTEIDTEINNLENKKITQNKDFVSSSNHFAEETEDVAHVFITS